MKTVLSLPLVRPLTGPSKLIVSAIVSPTLLPLLPATVVRATEGGVAPSVGAAALTTGSGVLSMSAISPGWAKALPAASTMAAASAVFSAASSIVACPVWEASMV